jgi:protein phosphatase
MSRSYRIEAVGATHEGLVRRENQDAFLMHEEIGFFAVADGVATRRDGAEAAQTAVAEVDRALAAALQEEPAGKPREAFVEAVLRANAHLYLDAQHIPDDERPATTFVGALLDNGLAHIVHVGDSRLWLFRGGLLRSLTVDHTMANQLIEHGWSEESARRHPHAAVVMRALGDSESALPTVRSEVVKSGDLLLASTDGLHGYVPEIEIRAILAVGAVGDLHAAARRLIDRALVYGGRDNVTVVLARVVATVGAEDEPPEPTPPTLRRPSAPEPEETRSLKGAIESARRAESAYFGALVAKLDTPDEEEALWDLIVLHTAALSLAELGAARRHAHEHAADDSLDRRDLLQHADALLGSMPVRLRHLRGVWEAHYVEGQSLAEYAARADIDVEAAEEDYFTLLAFVTDIVRACAREMLGLAS